MEIKIEPRITTFGEIVLRFGVSSPLIVPPAVGEAGEGIQYRVPQETAPSSSEINYAQRGGYYIIPFSTA